MNLNIFVSKECFVYCRGCYSYSREEKCSEILSTEKIERFLKYAYDKGITKVTLCGGDPLIRFDIVKLLKKIKKIGYKISIDTMGTSLIRDVRLGKNTIKKVKIEDICKYVDCIGIPIDGSCNEIIRLFRQSKFDILNDQLAICNLLSKYNIKICINTVAHKGNISDFENIAEIINKLDRLDKWQIFQFTPIGKYGLLNRKEFEISEKQFFECKEKTIKIFKNTEKLEFKESKSRVKRYMLIDNSGTAWIPEFEKNNTISNKLKERVIIGNIQNENDWEKICKNVIGNKKVGEIKNET